ncbi:MAG: UDP-glucose 4-epimerase GalE [Saprospiraceae bacterium]
MAKVIVTGGAGYIGSHTVVNLIEAGHEVVCIDNFFNSHQVMWSHLEELVGRKVPQYNVDLTDAAAVDQVFAEHSDADAVIHFAARIYVGESVEKPITYFRQNLNSMLNVLESMGKYGQRTFIFSSSCSVYGNAKQLPVTEATPFGVAESPYARTKQMGEQIITDFVRANPSVQGVILRYFNPAGAHPSGQIGEAPQVEQTHLVPIIMEVGTGHRKELTVFGGDYPTRDGSCLRDFIHVSDLGSAHTRAVEFGLERALAKTQDGNPSIFNLGSGNGVTVLEAVKAFETVTGNPLPHKIVDARDGDVAAIYATTTKAAEELGWTPQYSLEEIVRTAWVWEQARPSKLKA